MPPPRLPAFILYFIKRQRIAFTVFALVSLMWPVEQVLFPYCVKLIIDTFATYQGERAHIMDALAGPLSLGAVVWGASIIAWRIADVMDFLFSPRLQADIRQAMAAYVFGHSHRYFSEHFAGAIAGKIADMVHGVHYLVTQSIRVLFPNLVVVLLTAGVMATISVTFAVVLLLWASAHIGICILFSRACDRAGNAHAEARNALQGRIVDAIGNFSAVRLFAHAPFELRVIGRTQQEEIYAHRSLLLTLAKVRLALEVPCLAMIIFMLHFLIRGWQAGEVGTGDAAFILSTTLNLMYILWRVGMEFPTLYREAGVCRQALSLLQEAHEVCDAPDAKPLAIRRGEIVFENVHFDYHPGQDLFHGENLTICAGEKVGLVGLSGSGKTTFVNLIMRLYDLDGGRILIDGQDIASATQDSLRSQIAMIPQEPALFHRSLKENILYGRPDATEEEVIDAARQAQADEFIRAMPQGYDAVVGERGVKLSGGQRQRIAIARALLKRVPILILDEATAALDSATERAIQVSLPALLERRTALIIAHRLSTLSQVERILVFHEGAVVEDGTHEALLAADGHYARLWRLQTGGFLPE